MYKTFCTICTIALTGYDGKPCWQHCFSRHKTLIHEKIADLADLQTAPVCSQRFFDFIEDVPLCNTVAQSHVN